MPRVSVIIPVHNGARTVAAALDSVLAQTFTDYEIIAIDNNSTDASREVLARYADKVKILEEPKRGPSATRNTGVRASSGEYLAFLDADDWWRPTILERTVEVLDRDPECALVYTDLALADSTGREQMASLAGNSHPPTVDDMLKQLWPILPSGVLMRRRAFDLAGGFPEDLIAFEDVYLWLRAREHGTFQYLPEPLAVWRFALFPDPLKPAGGQDEAGIIFEQMVRERYHTEAHHHVLARRRAPRSILGYIGLRALREGDRSLARSSFARAIRIDPLRIKNYLRFSRTLLPEAIARALSGRSRSESAADERPSRHLWLWGLLTLFIFILGQHYLRPTDFGVFKDLFAMGFGLLCAIRNEDAARQAAQPNKWLGRKDTSDKIPLYRWAYAVGGVFFVIFGVVDLFFRL